MVEENDDDDVSIRVTVYMSVPVRRLEGCRLNYRNICGKRQKRVQEDEFCTAFDETTSN